MLRNWFWAADLKLKKSTYSFYMLNHLLLKQTYIILQNGTKGTNVLFQKFLLSGKSFWVMIITNHNKSQEQLFNYFSGNSIWGLVWSLPDLFPFSDFEWDLKSGLSCVFLLRKRATEWGNSETRPFWFRLCHVGRQLSSSHPNPAGCCFSHWNPTKTYNLEFPGRT